KMSVPVLLVFLNCFTSCLMAINNRFVTTHTASATNFSIPEILAKLNVTMLNGTTSGENGKDRHMGGNGIMAGGSLTPLFGNSFISPWELQQLVGVCLSILGGSPYML
ncbi:hypothetical protein SK128_016882, partial [Halocaridina rubra]